MTQSHHRIVVIDGHIIAQFHAGRTGWWTMCKGKTNDESDFAMWEESEVNMLRAVKFSGEDSPVVRTDLRPVQDRSGGWLAGEGDLSPKHDTPEGYRIALRELARSIESRGKDVQEITDALEAFKAIERGQKVSVSIDGRIVPISYLGLTGQGWHIVADGAEYIAPSDGNTYYVECSGEWIAC